MPIPDPEPIYADVAAVVEQAAEAAYQQTLALIAGGMAAGLAVEAAMRSFDGEYAGAMAQAFSALLQRDVTAASILAMPVGEITLSQRLYAHTQQTANEVAAIVRQQAQGITQARDLARRLYDGYNPADGIKRPLEGRARADLPKALRELTDDAVTRQELARLIERGQQQAARIKSEALKAAYLQAFEKATDGMKEQALRRALWVAEREKTRYMANRIAQTELKRAHTDAWAAEIMADEFVDVVQVKMNPRHPLPDICDVHARANLWGLGPGLYPKAKAPKPPFHPHCLTGDALITASGKITAVSKRWFDGDVVVIATASGKRLTATVNHPILTSSGWVKAGLLNVGNDVVARVVSEPVCGNALVDDDHQDVPTSIAEIANAFLRSAEVTTREVPLSPEDFHGDGVASDVAVIGANSELWDRVDAGSTQGFDYTELVFADPCPAALLGNGVLDFAGEGLGRPPNGIMRGFGHLGAALRANARKADDVLLPLGAQDNATFDEPLGHSVSGDAELARQIQDGATGPVFIDQVVSVNRHAFSGHVYNLETENGHYTGNGIITHNCWCRMVTRPDLSAEKAREREGAVRELLRSMPAAEAARVLGSKEHMAEVMNGGDWRKLPGIRLDRVGDAAESKRMQTSDFDDFFNNKSGSPERVVVATLTAAEMALFGVKNKELWLSRTSLDEHKAKHPEVTASDYTAIPEIVHNGAVWGGHQDRRYLLLQVGEKPYRAAIKVSQDDETAWFLSLVVSTKQKPPKGAVLLREAAGGSGRQP